MRIFPLPALLLSSTALPVAQIFSPKRALSSALGVRLGSLDALPPLRGFSNVAAAVHAAKLKDRRQLALPVRRERTDNASHHPTR